MVTAAQTRRWSACLVLGLGACLGKPSAPAGTSDAMPPPDGMMPDDAPDAAFCPAGMTPLPPNLLLRRIARVASNGANDTNDDVFVWGRTDNGNGTSAAYLVRGREPMELRCYDRAFTFGTSSIEIVDTWFGDLSRDSNPDLLLLARDDGPNNNYLINLYPGISGGGVEALPIERAASRTTFSSSIGGSLFTPFPAYITAWTSSTEAGVVFGGIHAPYGALVYDSDQSTILTPMPTQEGSMGLQFDSRAVQDMIRYTGSDPNRLLVVTNKHVYVIEHDEGSADAFTKIGSTTELTNDLQRFVRPWRQLYGNNELVAVTQDNGGFDIITYDGTTTRVRRLAGGNELDGGTFEDLAFGNLDGDTSLDLVALVSNNSAAKLVIYRNLVFGTNTVTSASAKFITLPKSHNILAVGDFDGDATTPDSILALQTSVTGPLGRCVHFVAESACLAECGSTTCLSN